MASGSNGTPESFAKVPAIKYTKLFINGEFADSISGKKFETMDPRTGEVISRIAEGDKDDIDLAVKTARHAFGNGPWPRMSGSARGRIMVKYAELFEEHAEELAALDAIDAGKLYNVGKAVDIHVAANMLRYHAGAADKIHGEVLKMSGELQAYTLREPIAKDEIFGPVMSLMKFKTIDEAIKSANNTRYGLAAGIVTQNLDVANTVSRSIRAGIIWINCYFGFDNDCPYGGYKMSGFGRDLGLDALHKYLQVKSVVAPIYNSPWL